jgi:hypothetical protein
MTFNCLLRLTDLDAIAEQVSALGDVQNFLARQDYSVS